MFGCGPRWEEKLTRLRSALKGFAHRRVGAVTLGLVANTRRLAPPSVF
jgi:hypothetical protein